MKIVRNFIKGHYSKISMLEDLWEDFQKKRISNQTCILILKTFKKVKSKGGLSFQNFHKKAEGFTFSL